MKIKFVILAFMALFIHSSAQAQEKAMKSFVACFKSAKRTNCLSKVFALADFNPNYKNDKGLGYLHIAAQYNNEYATKVLLNDARFTEMNAVDIENRATALHYAANCDADIVINLLLKDSRVDANPRDRYRRTPIFYTQKKPINKVKALKALLASIRTDRNIRSEMPNQHSFMEEVAIGNEIDLASVLYADASVDIHAKNYFGHGLLHFAGENRSDKVAKLLLQLSKNRKDDLEAQDDHGLKVYDTNPVMFAKILKELGK